MPTLTVAPVQAGTSGSVRGEGFGSRTNVRLLVGGSEVSYFTTGSGGTFTRTIPSKPAGTYPVAAYSTRGCATASWVVDAVVEPPPPPPPPGPDPVPDRPFPAPVTTNTVTVPDHIDTSTELNAWIAAVPNGSRVGLVPGRDYLMTNGLLFQRKQHIVIDGNDARLVMQGPDAEENSPLLLRGSHHIKVDDLRVKGAYSGVPAVQGEKASLFCLSAWYGNGPSTYAEMGYVTADHIYSDYVYVEGNIQNRQPSHHIWVHHNRGDHCGRNAVSPIDGTDALIENNVWDHINYHVYDIEPNLTEEQVRRWTFRNETVGSYAHRAGLVGYFVRNWNPPGNAPVSDILVTSVTVKGIAANGYNGKPMGLTSRFDSPSSNVAITNCSTAQPVAGPAFVMNNVAGLRVTGNTQPLTSGSLFAGSGNSGTVTTSPNP